MSFRNDSHAVPLDDSALNTVTGGVQEDDPMSNGRCPKCGFLLSKKGSGYTCKQCGTDFDSKKKPIS